MSFFPRACKIARDLAPDARASERRSRLTYADLSEVLRDGEDPDATALLDAVHNYDNAEIGRLFSRMVQDYCRRECRPSIWEVPQAD